MRRRPERRLKRRPFFFIEPILRNMGIIFKEVLNFGKKKTEASSVKSFGLSPNEAVVVEIKRAVV